MFGQFVVLERVGIGQCFEVKVANPKALVALGAIFVDCLHTLLQRIQSDLVDVLYQRVGRRGKGWSLVGDGGLRSKRQLVEYEVE